MGALREEVTQFVDFRMVVKPGFPGLVGVIYFCWRALLALIGKIKWWDLNV